MNHHELKHRLHVYEDRLKHETDLDRREFFQREIIAMINDIESIEAVEELMNEINEHDQPWEVKTDSFETVKQLIKETQVIYLDTFFSWQQLRRMYIVLYHEKKRNF